jgi:C-terminal peptidase prc
MFTGSLKPAKPTAPQLREIADKAERAGDWEAAFNAYCHLFVLDRSTPELRDKLNTSLRYVQQLRRHRDPAFQQFATGMPLDSGLDLFAEVIQKIPTVYADRDKATAQHLWGYAIQELDRALGNGTFRTAFLENAKPEKVEQFRAVLRDTWAKRTIADQSHARANMRRLIAAAQDHFAVRVPAAFAVEAACGACSGLDEYTVFLTPNAGAEVSPIHDLSAAGLFLGVAKGQLVIEGILPNSWIAHAYPQLRPGDRVTALNNKPMDVGGIPNAVTALRKPVDGFHLIDIRGNDDAKLQLRVPLVIPSVYGTRMIPDKPVGYTRIGNFQPATPRELDVALASLKDAGARAIVLDLRGNHGGSFLAAVETARRLLPNGVIVTTQGQLTEVASQTFNSTSGGSAHDIPVVLLIDAETASAAEVLAAALKDNNRATVVGMPSFGKGTLQYPMRLVTLDDIDPATGKKVSKTGTVRVTIAKLIAPTSGPLNGNGLSPHFLEADPILQLELAATKAEERAATQMMPTMPSMPALPSPSLPMIP